LFQQGLCYCRQFAEPRHFYVAPASFPASHIEQDKKFVKFMWTLNAKKFKALYNIHGLETQVSIILVTFNGGRKIPNKILVGKTHRMMNERLIYRMNERTN
jgi:hypothetical protein